MPLHILGPMVVIGVIGVAILLHLMGLSKRLRFDESTARAAWLRHFPDASVRTVHVAPDGHAALIHSTDGPGIVWAMGADSAARFVHGARPEQRPDQLVLHFRDIGTPTIRLAVPAALQDDWLKEIGPL